MRYATQPAPPVNLANQRHRDGMSCKTVAAYRYDANGYKRWCIDCGVELGEQAWHPDGADVGPRGIGAVFAGAGLIAMLVLVILFGSAMTDGAGTPVPPHVPTTYGPPPTVVP